MNRCYYECAGSSRRGRRRPPQGVQRPGYEHHPDRNPANAEAETPFQVGGSRHRPPPTPRSARSTTATGTLALEAGAAAWRRLLMDISPEAFNMFGLIGGPSASAGLGGGARPAVPFEIHGCWRRPGDEARVPGAPSEPCNTCKVTVAKPGQQSVACKGAQRLRGRVPRSCSPQACPTAGARASSNRRAVQ